MKIKKLPIVSLALVASLLSSCNENAEIEVIKPNFLAFNVLAANDNAGEPIVSYSENGEVIKLNDPDTDPELKKLTSFEITTPVVSLYINSGTRTTESLQLNYKFAPANADVGTVTWSSSNSKVASVDKNGKVKSVKEGVATITAKAKDGTTAECRVIVNDSNITKKEASDAINGIKAQQQAADFRYKNKATIREDYKYEKKIDGVVVETVNFYEILTASIDDAFFKIYEYELDSKTSGGSLIPYEADYVFSTNSDYDTTCWKTSRIAKNYLVVDTSSLVGKKTKFEALCSVLDNFFTSGSGIVTDQLREVLGTSNFNSFNSYFSYVKNYGSLSTDNTQFAYQLVQTFDDTVSADEEADLGIPGGTPINFSIDIRYLWENSVATTKQIIQKETATYNNHEYEFTYNVNYFYDIDNVEIVEPDLSGYTKVDSIFDL